MSKIPAASCATRWLCALSFVALATSSVRAQEPAASAPVTGSAAPAASAASTADKPSRPEVVAEMITTTIPLHGVTLFGGDLPMATLVFHPPGPGPFPVVVFSHGRSAEPAVRAALKVGVSRAQLRFWLARGDAVVAPIRPGYGDTGGADYEGARIEFEPGARCRGRPHYDDVAAAASRTVAAALDWLKTQPWADTRHVLLAGQSYGGFTTIAAGAQPHDGVVGYINYAGGLGGNSKMSPGRSCHPEQVTELLAQFGKATTLPNLWIYAENDEFWGADVPVAWHDAFAAGGSRTTFVHAPPVDGGKGHGLSTRAPALWAPAVEAFLATIDFPGRAVPAASAADPATHAAQAPLAASASEAE